MTSRVPLLRNASLYSIYSLTLNFEITISAKAPEGVKTINRNMKNSNMFKEFVAALNTEIKVTEKKQNC